MTRQELFAQQQELQTRAHIVLDELDLMHRLNEIGETNIVGSLAMGMMAWPDIDLEVYVDEYNVQHLTKISESLLLKYRHIGIHLRDYRLDSNPNKPKGLYIGVKYEFRGEKWKLDIWLLKPEHKQVADFTKHMTNLSDEQREIILQIKNQVWSHPEYRKQFASVDIYDAVLNNKVSNLVEFNDYLRTTGRQL